MLSDTPSSQLGSYSLYEPVLGKGAFGEVFVASSAGSYYALKRLKRHLAQAEIDGVHQYRRRFSPGQSAYKVNLVPIFHVDKDRESLFHYYTMPLADDWLNGIVEKPEPDYKPLSLSSYLELNGKLDFDDLLSLADQVLRGICQLHSQRLVHRDIKPGNIIRWNNKWCIGDFGLLTRRSNDCSNLGTIGFIPPEGTGDYSGDIYAFGKTILWAAVRFSAKLRPNDAPHEMLRNGKLTLPYDDDRRDALTQLILGCCDVNLDSRLMPSQILKRLGEIPRQQYVYEIETNLPPDEFRRALAAAGLPYNICQISYE